MTTALHQRVRKTIERHALCPPGTRVLVGLSGGSDSVALLFLLRDLAENGRFTVAGLAHLNHQLRTTAQRDEAFCRDLAGRLNLRIVVKNEDVQGYARGRNLSVEDAARRIRYDFMEQAAGDLGAERIAVGHTQDDQAETFLLKLIRGAGLTGLGGIHPRRDRVIRPLLDVPRADLRQYLLARGEPWIEDESNEDLDNPRNRIRHVVLPELDRAAGGATRPSIARACGLLREDAGFHMVQNLEAAVRQFQAWHAEPEAASTLIGAARYLAAHSPTRRARYQIAEVARRLMSGSIVSEDAEAVLNGAVPRHASSKSHGCHSIQWHPRQ